MEPITALTPENYAGGFLVDEDLMAGVATHPEENGQFIAFVLQHSTGEYLGYQAFPSLELALRAINQIPRAWTFEKLGGGCGGGNCATGGCATGGCAKSSTLSCPQSAPALT